MDGYIRCPEIFRADDARRMDRTLFLGGGITGCGDWQAEFAGKVAGSGSSITCGWRGRGSSGSRPRRCARSRSSSWASSASAPTRCSWASTPEYKRRIDVETQLRFARPLDHAVHHDLDSLAAAVRAWAATL